jgi:hypothetical protein
MQMGDEVTRLATQNNCQLLSSFSVHNTQTTDIVKTWRKFKIALP